MAVLFVLVCATAFGWPMPTEMPTTLLDTHYFSTSGGGSAGQGIALGDNYYYGSNNSNICRFDKNWNFIESVPIAVAGVNHLGAIDYHDGYIWGGFLNGPAGDCGMIAKIDASDLTIVKTWDITSDLTWIDPVCFDGEHLWVGDLSHGAAIYRYSFTDDDDLVLDGKLAYPSELSFSQGIRVVGDRLYSIHTFGSMEGLYEFMLPADLTGALNYPVRMWDINRTGSGDPHLEGFAFVPGSPNHIWQSLASGNHVDFYELGGVAVPVPGAASLVLMGAGLLCCFRGRRRPR